jgi:FdhD protein
MVNLKITKIRGGKREETEATLVQEVPLTITLRDTELATFLCTPVDLEELILGFLFTSGIITKKEDIKELRIDRKRWTAYLELTQESVLKDMVFKRVYTSGCGRGLFFYNAFDLISKKEKITSAFSINSDTIFEHMSHFQKKSEWFQKTGGIHSAAIADKNGILVFKEDIGRHNAIDKIIGCCLKEKIPLGRKVLLTTGRISSEVLFKVHKSKCPIIISRSAPSDQAVKLAIEMNITMAGFVRGKSMNIYSVPHRIID